MFKNLKSLFIDEGKNKKVTENAPSEQEVNMEQTPVASAQPAARRGDGCDDQRRDRADSDEA